MVAGLVWRCCVARTRVTRTVWCLSARALRRLPLGPFGAFCSGCAWWWPIPHGSPTMSHVIPLRVFQILKSCRWDCNVCGVSRKMTKLNYVRHFSALVSKLGRVQPTPTGIAAGSSCRAFSSGLQWALSWQPIPHGSPTMSHVIPLRVFQILKSCRWDCNVCGVSRKMTKLNYVRLWGRGLRASSAGPVHQSQFIRASSAARCSRASRFRRSTGACGR